MIEFKNYMAVIFDMDGLLLDSEKPFIQAFEVACKDFDVEFDISVMLKAYGTNEEETLRIFSNHFDDTDLSEKLLSKTFERFDEIIQDKPLVLMEGAEGLLKNIFLQKIPMGLATSTSEEIAISHLKKAKILQYFKQVVTGDMVSNGKPDPEIYLKVSEKLAVSPSDCLAFEDSDNGVRSAHGAGMTVIQVPNLAPPCDEVRAFGHLILDSLSKVIGD